MNKGPIVFVVEDDDDDLFLLQRELAKIETSAVHYARDGREAVEYLKGDGRFADRARHPTPDILFLDLKLPRLSGHEVLAWIRSRPEFKNLRVYILTGSDEPKDRVRVEEIGAAGYFVKPLLASQLREIFDADES